MKRVATTITTLHLNYLSTQTLQDFQAIELFPPCYIYVRKF
jgi:hypothetical protein